MKSIPKKMTVIAASCLLLFFLFFRGFIHYPKPISEAKALATCSFVLITEEEYDLLRQLRQDKDIVSYITKETPPSGTSASGYEFKEIEAEILARYDYTLTANGASIPITSSTISDYGSIFLDFSNGETRCILTLSSTGAVSKTCAEYKGANVTYILENKDNEEFTKSAKIPKVLYDLFLQ